ncbi:MAG: GFA family protein [Hyphomicrobiaceae bacterium]
MKIDGGCHCGELAYEAIIDPRRISICHCSDCQIMSGAAFRTVAHVATDQFKLLRGDPRIYVKIAGSGNARTMAFCGNCGTQLYGTGDGEAAKLLSLRIGTCNQRADLRPVRQIWRRSAVKWLDGLGIAESHQRGEI